MADKTFIIRNWSTDFSPLELREDIVAQIDIGPTVDGDAVRLCWSANLQRPARLEINTDDHFAPSVGHSILNAIAGHRGELTVADTIALLEADGYDDITDYQAARRYLSLAVGPREAYVVRNEFSDGPPVPAEVVFTTTSDTFMWRGLGHVRDATVRIEHLSGPGWTTRLSRLIDTVRYYPGEPHRLRPDDGQSQDAFLDRHATGEVMHLGLETARAVGIPSDWVFTDPCRRDEDSREEGLSCTYVDDRGDNYDGGYFVAVCGCLADALHGRPDLVDESLPDLPGTVRDYLEAVPPEVLIDWLRRTPWLSHQDRETLREWIASGAPDIESPDDWSGHQQQAQLG